MKKVLFILISLFFCTSMVNALELCTPSQEYLDYMKLSEEERSKYIAPTYCSEIMNKDNDDNAINLFNHLSKYVSASKTDPSYNSKTEGYVTSVKNQYNLGTCWAFSSISAVESNALKNGLGSLDLSEMHLLQSVLSAAYSDNAGKSGKYNVSNFNGGKVTYAASYFYNNYGQLTENELPYDRNGNKINSSQYKKGRNIVSLGTFKLANLNDYGACTTDEIDYIKDQIIKYGSVQGNMYMDENLLDSTNNYYMATTSNSTLSNHGISIIGWDDNISKSKFPGATRNGAFIIKNSWGSSWSGDGLFYTSYDDHFICKDVTTFADVSTASYDNTYKSADMIGVPAFMFNNNFYTTSKFTKTTSGTEVIKRISFATAENASYKVYVSKDNDLTNSSNWIQISSGTTDFLGIKSIDVNLEVEDDFTVIIKYTTTSYTAFMAMCNNQEDTSLMEYDTTNNYYSNNGYTWNSLSNITIDNTSISCEPNIFVYTNDVIIDDGESITSLDNNFVSVDKLNILVNISNNYTLSYEDLISKLNIVAPSYIVYDKNNTTIGSESTITTNSKIKLTNKLFNIIVMGDVNSDGKISALDYIEVRKHIMGTKITDSGKLLSADMDKSNSISALDYIAIRKILMR